MARGGIAEMQAEERLRDHDLTSGDLSGIRKVGELVVS